MTARNSDGTIAIATHGNGVYSSTCRPHPSASRTRRACWLVAALAQPRHGPRHLHAIHPTALRTHEVRVVDLGGRTVLQEPGRSAARQQHLALGPEGDGGARVPAGTYLVVFSGTDGSRVQARVIVP